MHGRLLARFAATGLSLGLGAGGGGETTETLGDDVDVADLTFAACARQDDVGGFTLELADDFTGLGGQVFDGVVPGSPTTTGRGCRSRGNHRPRRGRPRSS